MPIAETLAPLILLIALGAGLAHIRFLGREFMVDLNKMAFWIALPALLFISASQASRPDLQTARLLAVLIAGTLLVTFLAWGISAALQMPLAGRGTLMQSAFRGNLAYIGLPVLAYSLGKETKIFASAVIVMVLLMSFFNMLAVVVLQGGSRHGSDWKKALRSIATNPLLLAGLLGVAFSFTGLLLPVPIHHALEILGAAAVPISLLCIGGALAITPLHGKRSWIVVSAFLKVAALPLLVYAIGKWAGLDVVEQRIALVFAACPTAAASFVMVKQMGGDEPLASGSIALSTIFSALSLAAALWLTT